MKHYTTISPLLYACTAPITRSQAVASCQSKCSVCWHCVVARWFVIRLRCKAKINYQSEILFCEAPGEVFKLKSNQLFAGSHLHRQLRRHSCRIQTIVHTLNLFLSAKYYFRGPPFQSVTCFFRTHVSEFAVQYPSLFSKSLENIVIMHFYC